MTERLKIYLVILIGAALRILAACWPESLWSDEITSIYFANHPSWEAVLWDSSPPIYLALLKLWLKVVPSTELGARSLSAIFSIAALLVGVRGFKKNFWFLAFLSLNPLSIAMAGEVKNASLFELGAMWNLIQFKEWRENRGSVLSYVISLFTMGVIHYVSGAVAVAQGVYIYASSWRRPTKSWTPLMISLQIFVVLNVFTLFVTGLIRPQTISWMTEFHQGRPWLLATEPLRVLGSYSWSWTIGSILLIFFWTKQPFRNNGGYFALLIAATWVGSYAMDRTLGFRRLLMAVNLGYLLALSPVPSFLPTLERRRRIAGILLLALGFVITTKKIVEDVIWERSAWKTAAAEMCATTGSNPPAPFILSGHVSLRYYFPEPCGRWLGYDDAKALWMQGDRTPILLTKWFAERMQRELKMMIRTVKIFGSDSQEPVYLLEPTGQIQDGNKNP